MSEPVITVAHWQTTADALDRVLANLSELQTHSLAEPGCFGYEAFQNKDDPTTIVPIERYQDDDALEAHLKSPHYQRIVVEQVRPLLTDRRVEFLRPRNPLLDN